MTGQCVTLLGMLFTFAVKRGLLADNPARGVEKPPVRKQNRDECHSSQKGVNLSDIHLPRRIFGPETERESDTSSLSPKVPHPRLS